MNRSPRKTPTNLMVNPQVRRCGKNMLPRRWNSHGYILRSYSNLFSFILIRQIVLTIPYHTIKPGGKQPTEALIFTRVHIARERPHTLNRTPVRGKEEDYGAELPEKRRPPDRGGCPAAAGRDGPAHLSGQRPGRRGDGSVIALGGSKSGKPCARLIAPQSMLMRVIRRMTESVKCSFLLLSSCMVSLLPFSFVRVGRACVLPARALFIIAKL